MWTGIDVRLLTASIVALEEITVANDIEDVVDDGGAPADPVATHGPFLFTKTSTVATRTATFEEWSAATAWAQQVEGAVQFWIGDLIEYGEYTFGEKYAQAIDATGSSYQTLADAAYVARHVPVSRRRENLSFAMHREVAPLPPAEQEKWLNCCEAKGLTREQLRVEIKAAQSTLEHPVELWLLVKCKDIADQNGLADRMRLEGRSVKMTTNDT